MNPTQAKFNQQPEQFNLTSGYEFAVFSGGTIVTTAAVTKETSFLQPGTDEVTVPLPGTLFDGIPSGSYQVAVRPVNEGGPGPWLLSEAIDLIGEPTAITNLTLQ